ncbi:tripartite tricarboxylate transporter substrate binding protein [Pigmentiphaga sp.]|uniref:Bug family tripartite tricarboxylate transporter substrate binding protein n=1 Tax=Pigmentiphaga sp. TaxID=1977564 RepID=UPI00128AFC8B|nr:tripartite tricarboxylate transporter substrate binding protein [Pigmentiphaga sp.]MPS26944.1 tripartite tricarboxylate transporter substrate binding protein [Alcaligenaceae bacterium SAGV5]MPS51932.1 tripartite tricarboxylate transporter substrate binding protein [Alcaligenaceae bacterium SAGV3]MPT58421.1 tripartite tricarboxylate transporter substrate binding protein [Alcaligenaceae bacterium]
MLLKRYAALTLFVALPAAQCLAQSATAWPSKPISLVVGFTPGGPSDILARAMAKQMSERLGQPIVINSRPGAGGNIAAAAVAGSPADGYTWLFGNNSILSTNAALYANLPFDPEKDFAAAGLVGVQPSILVVNSNVPARSVRELVALARSKPGELNYASSGAGAAAHLVGQWLVTSADLKIEHVPYKGAQPALTDMIAGQVQLMFATAASVVPYINQGRLRPLAVTSAKRMQEFPDVPTMIEAGFDGFVAETWHGIVVPAGTPPAIVERINQEIRHALDSKEIRAQFRELGVEPAPGTTQAFADFIKSETPKWTRLVKDSGARVE